MIRELSPIDNPQADDDDDEDEGDDDGDDEVRDNRIFFSGLFETETFVS